MQKLIIQTVLFLLIALMITTGLWLAAEQNWKAFWIAAVCFIGAFILLAWALLRFAMDSSFVLALGSYCDNETQRTLPAFQEASAWFMKHHQPVSILSEDHLELQANYMDHDSDKTIIVVHGYANGAPDGMCEFARQFYEEGCNVLCPILRGHNPSSGSWITMGWKDKDDLLQWISWLLTANPRQQIVLFGVSMGGATVMMAADQVPGQVTGIIEDCGYPNLAEQFFYQLKDCLGILAIPVLAMASLLSKLKLHFFFTEATAIPALHKTTLPFLFIHGTKDDLVPFEMLEESYQACGSRHKKKVVVEGAVHANSVFANPQLYWSSVHAFLQEAFSANTESAAKC